MYQNASADLPEFDNLPSLSDETVGDILQHLLATVDTFEDHYAEPVCRLRKQYFEQERADAHEQQHDRVNDAEDNDNS